MSDFLPSPIRVEVAGGFVPSAERAYAHDVVGALCRHARCGRGRVELSSLTNAGIATSATADAILVLDEYRLLCAGAVAATMGEAIDELEARLLRQVIDLSKSEHALKQLA